MSPRRRRTRRLLFSLAAACAAAGVLQLAATSAGQDTSSAGPTTDVAQSSAPAEIAEGRRLFVESCSSCHGFDARGVEGTGPSLRGVGGAAVEFYVSTGRMPLDEPGDQPLRAEPAFDDEEIAALVAYIGAFGGPRVPDPDPDAGNLADGLELFTSFCSGCHGLTGEGGVVIRAFAPKLTDVEPTDVAAAIRTGPYVMPRFSEAEISDPDVDSITRYVRDVVQDPDDRGGWGIGHLGPVPEGLVAWLLAAVVLLGVTRLIGTRGA